MTKWYARVQHNINGGYSNNNVKEDIVKLYCLSCHLFLDEFHIIHVRCMHKQIWYINVLTRNYLCTVIL